MSNKYVTQPCERNAKYLAHTFVNMMLLAADSAFGNDDDGDEFLNRE